MNYNHQFFIIQSIMIINQMLYQMYELASKFISKSRLHLMVFDDCYHGRRRMKSLYLMDLVQSKENLNYFLL